MYIYKYIFLLLIIITENVHIIYAYKIIAGRKGKKKQEKVRHEKKREIEKKSEAAILMWRFWKKSGVKTKIEVALTNYKRRKRHSEAIRT